MTHRSFYWQISALCFVLGLLLAAASQTTSQINRSGSALNRPGFAYGPSVQVAARKAMEYEAEIKKKNDYITELESKVSKGTSAASMLNEELQKLRFFAGVTDAVGPGVQVTLVDSVRAPVAPVDQFQQKNLIHDVDIANVVNELKAAGAEAIAVNGQRVVSSTAVRCVGPVVHVNGVPAAPPYVVTAIGDINTLYNALNMQNGVLDELRRYDPAMARLDKKNKLVLAAFAGRTQPSVARPRTDASPKKDTEE